MQKNEKFIFWQTHIDSQIASGLTQRSYCRQHQIPHKSFSRWKQKIFNKECLDKEVKMVSQFSEIKIKKESIDQSDKLPQNVSIRFEKFILELTELPEPNWIVGVERAFKEVNHV